MLISRLVCHSVKGLKDSVKDLTETFLTKNLFAQVLGISCCHCQLGEVQVKLLSNASFGRLRDSPPLNSTCYRNEQSHHDK